MGFLAASSLSAEQVEARALVALQSPDLPPFVESRWRWLSKWLANPTGSNSERWLWIVIFATIVIMRQPRVVLEGRFWAEEGSIFFEHAWNLPWDKALFLPYAGYLNLIANLAGVLARYLAPLWAAPYVNTGLALIIQCIPAVLIVTSRTDWLQPRVVVGAALLLIATSPYAFEVNLSSIGSQFYLALAVALILVLEPRRGALRALQWCVLFVAPLSGPASWVLLPLFAVRAAIEQSRPRALQTCILFAGVMLQVGLFYGHAGGRSIGISPSLFGAIVFTKQVCIPLFGYAPWDKGILKAFARSFSEIGGPLWPLVTVGILGVIVGIAVARCPHKAPLWLFSSAVAMVVISYFGALGPKIDLVGGMAGARYAMPPQVLLDLCLLSWCVLHRGSMRFWSGCAAAWLIVTSLLDFPLAQSGPPWRPQAQKWQQDHSYALQIWPRGWTMRLPAQ